MLFLGLTCHIYCSTVFKHHRIEVQRSAHLLIASNSRKSVAQTSCASSPCSRPRRPFPKKNSDRRDSYLVHCRSLVRDFRRSTTACNKAPLDVLNSSYHGVFDASYVDLGFGWRWRMTSSCFGICCHLRGNKARRDVCSSGARALIKVLRVRSSVL